MKTSTFLIVGMLVSFNIYSNSAKACSMMPVDVEKQTIDMQRFILTALDIEEINVTSFDVSDATGRYIWSDRMCPEGIAANATFTVSFNNPSDPLTKGCTGVVKVSKTEPTGLSEILVKHVYEVEIVQSGICLE